MKGSTRRTLIFDADGVVIDPAHQFMEYLEHKLQVPPESSSEFFGGAFRDCLVGRADLKEAIAPFLPRWGWRRSVDEFLQVWFDVENHANLELVRIIQNLRQDGYHCVIATNQEKYRLQYLRQQMGFARLFDAVIGSADVGEVKPNAGFYQEVTARLGVRPEAVYFWDDSESNVEGARAFGWRAEHYKGIEGFVSTIEQWR